MLNGNDEKLILTEKHLCQSLFFNKVAEPATLFKKTFWRRCFLVEFAKFLRTPFLTELPFDILMAKYDITAYISFGMGSLSSYLLRISVALLKQNLWAVNDWDPYHIKYNPLICRANQWTGFNMIRTSVMKEWKKWISRDFRIKFTRQ